MSDQVTIGDYSLEISGDEVLVRDETGAIVEEVKLDDVEGELTLPDGKKIDLASILADNDVAALQTAAGPANDNLGFIDGRPGFYHAFHPTDPQFGGFHAAGTLGDTSLAFTASSNGGEPQYDGDRSEQAPILVTWSSHEPWRIAENQAGGSLGALIEGDPAAFMFKLSDSRFEVVDGVLRVRDGVSFDFEFESNVDLEITATSRTGDIKTLSAHVTIADVNEAQTGLSLDHTAVNENAAGALVGTLLVADPDANDRQSFTVSDDRFEVVDGILKLKDGIALDHESEPNVSVTVTATDSVGHQIAPAFAIDVADVNEAPTDIGLSGNSLVENVAGAVIGTVTVVDPDSGDAHSFEVSDNRFEVTNGQLKLKDGVSLDFETEPSLDVTVTAIDSAGNKAQETFTLSVGNANEAQTDLALDHDQVMEHSAGTMIGNLMVADPDAGDSQSFAVSDGRFEVVNGQLKLKDGVSLDHESEPTVDVQVTATDAGGNQIARTFTIAVSDVNEAQTSLTLSNNSVTENAKGAVIGNLLAVNPDAGDKQSYSVSDSRFQVVNGQLRLKSGISLDHEGEPQVDVKVTATDKSGHQISQTFTIDVGDVNEKQTGIALSATKVTENDKGAVIGALSVTDPDAGDSQSFKVSDNRFEVVNGQLKLKDGVSLNHESAATVNVKVTATDAANHQIGKTFAIGVQDVNEAQTAMTLSGAKVTENVPGATIGTLKVTDPDKGDSQSYSVSDDRFEIVNGQLKLKDGVSLDYEQGSKISVGVTATDSASHEITKTFTIAVSNVYEAQTGMTLSANTVKENAAGATIGRLTVVDPDAGDRQTFTVSDDRFQVVSNQLRLKPGVPLDFEQGSSLDVDVTATDRGGNQITKTFTINVTDLNEKQTALALDNAQVDENTPGGVIGTLSVTDPDAGDAQTFKVSDNRFEVVGGQLKLKSGVFFDHETTDSVDVTATATDSAKHSISQPFTITIGNVNEAPVAAAAGSTFHSPSLQPTVDFSDVDSNALSQAVIHTTGFQAGDTLNVPASSVFNVTIDHSTADYTITIVGKTGTETIDQYEDFAGSISFSTSSNTAGDRHIDYAVTDSGGATSNVSTADIVVNSHSELYTSQMGKALTTLGAGDDIVHIDSKSFNPIDMGAGEDTVHPAQQNRSFDHQDAVKLLGVESIDATGSGANDVSLSIDDVLSMTDSDNHLTIIGDKGDSVTLTGNGDNQWTVATSNAEFTTYIYNDPSYQAVVEVSNQLNTQVS